VVDAAAMEEFQRQWATYQKLVDTATTGTAFWIGKLRPGKPTGAGNLIRRVGKLAAHYYRRIAGACIASDTKPAFLGRCTGLAGC